MPDVAGSEPYSDLGGLNRGNQWDERGALQRDCPDCGSKAGVKCTFEAQFYRPGTGMVAERRTRHMPCKNRIVNGGN